MIESGIINIISQNENKNRKRNENHTLLNIKKHNNNLP